MTGALQLGRYQTIDRATNARYLGCHGGDEQFTRLLQVVQDGAEMEYVNGEYVGKFAPEAILAEQEIEFYLKILSEEADKPLTGLDTL